MLNAIAVIPRTTTPIIAVLAFQLAGCAYHPPDGDQTCFGYLQTDKPTALEWNLQSHRICNRCVTYGIFPPLECEIEAPFDSADLSEWSFSIARGN